MEDKICISSANIKTGVDIVYTNDMHELSTLSIGVWLTEQEWQDTAYLSNQFQQLQRLAGKFACKEAIIKVLERGLNEIELVDIEVLHDSFGKPIVFLQGAALERWRQIAVSHLDVSISHHKDYTVAIAVAICSKNGVAQYRANASKF